uniref:adaptor protein MecA n=1 Tax=Agathobacter sp. TaxID=2021311 RepID=UPI0040570205
MEFFKDEKNSIRCIIREDEIEALGYTIDEIISNGTRTQEFMNEIFDMAEEELGMKFEMGKKAVRADVLPDHTLSLTFSEHPVSADEMMGHIKDIINGLLNSLPQKGEMRSNAAKKLEGLKERLESETKIVVLFLFESMDILTRFAKVLSIEALGHNSLYKFEEGYFLMIDLNGMDETDVKRLSALADEYASDIFAGAEKRAFIWEHGKAILRERAIEQLKLL